MKNVKLTQAYVVLKMLFIKLTEEHLSIHHVTEAVNIFKAEYNHCNEINKPSTLLVVLTRMFEQVILSTGITCSDLSVLNEASSAACIYSRDGVSAELQARNFLLVYA